LIDQQYPETGLTQMIIGAGAIDVATDNSDIEISMLGFDWFGWPTSSEYAGMFSTQFCPNPAEPEPTRKT
jgi:hypothetical protein